MTGDVVLTSPQGMSALEKVARGSRAVSAVLIRAQQGALRTANRRPHLGHPLIPVNVPTTAGVGTATKLQDCEEMGTLWEWAIDGLQ